MSKVGRKKSRKIINKYIREKIKRWGEKKKIKLT